MKKIILTLLLSAIVPFILMADPPKKVTVTYTKETSTVKVVVFHPVANAATHYVKKITIKVDGKEVKTFNETTQDNNKTDSREVVLKGIKPGSIIEATADCSIMGSKKGKIKVE